MRGPIRCRIAAWNISFADSSDSPSRMANSSSFSLNWAATTPVAPMDSATAFWNVPEHSWKKTGGRNEKEKKRRRGESRVAEEELV